MTAPSPEGLNMKDDQIVALARLHRGNQDWEAFSHFSHVGLLTFARALLAAAPAQSAKPVAYVSPNGATRIVLLNGASLNDDDELYAAPPSQHAEGGESAQCPTCHGNDADMPCAFPEGGKPGCPRDARLGRVSAVSLDDGRAAGIDIALDALAEYQRNWDTGLPAEYAQSERIAMECAVEAVREVLNDVRAASLQPVAQPVELDDERAAFERHWYNFYHSGSIKARSNGRYMQPVVQHAWEAWQARAASPQPVAQTRICDHNYVNGQCTKCGCVSAGE